MILYEKKKIRRKIKSRDYYYYYFQYALRIKKKKKEKNPRDFVSTLSSSYSNNIKIEKSFF